MGEIGVIEDDYGHIRAKLAGKALRAGGPADLVADIHAASELIFLTDELEHNTGPRLEPDPVMH